MKSQYTQKQGQHLAFIYYYTTLSGYPPAERDMKSYLKTSPPNVHQMIVTLEEQKLISR